MKVLTLTTQFANNFGALLQCYALSRYIKQCEHCECEVINYLPQGFNRSWALVTKPKSIKDLVRQILFFVRPDMILGKIRRNREMKRFIKTRLPLTKKYLRKDILISPPQADVYICGSDQIWNWKLFTDHTYYLDFIGNKNPVKKVSYAASIADPWPDMICGDISQLLQKFDAISIRERGNLEQVQQLTVGKLSPKLVIDPVFLMNQEDWLGLMDTRQCPNEPYILCYFLSSIPLGVATVRKIRELTGYKIVALNLGARDKFNCDKIIRAAGPEDFLGLIHNASYICTNSFHASAFSIIFRKDFLFVPKSMANERIYNLQQIFGIGNRCVTYDSLNKLTLGTLKVNYSSADENSRSFITNSKEYLHKAIWESK